LDNQPVLARRPSVLYRIRKFVQRRRTMMMVTGTVGAILLIGLVTSTLLYVRVKHATRTVATLDRQMEADRRLSTAQKLYAEGLYGTALAEMENQDSDDTSAPEAQLLRAQILSTLGRYADAEMRLKLLVNAEPKIGGAAHYMLARIYRQTDPAKSREHSLRAEELLPHTADDYALRALTSVRRARWCTMDCGTMPTCCATSKQSSLCAPRTLWATL
jgi:tetratricopeptide (TPR) repeat protein